ncbi:tyrosine-type recombinase/integrase [Rhodopirellula sp. P2]|uniref:tyrosine-type recombinase/integrase n=1 Tax=Rhodopirellula sp. P2 TaxID=2127060 RepID=UPI0023675909|nr:tyrosine-type recombinase/integrase [Rhodopirellula sp. P2]WDQ16376.1 tyrosine-type recombinase/integrase [Rhodopirellula sp. P2]
MGGVEFYLGKYDSPESRAKYHELLGQYLKNGKQAPEKPAKDNAVRLADEPVQVRHLTADFRAKVLPLHEDNAANFNKFSNLLDLLDALHGKELASEFGPRKLEAIRDTLVTVGIGLKPKPNSRSYANAQVRKLIAIFRHGVSRELIEASRIVALEALPPLRPGQAKDNPKRTGVPLEVIRATLPEMSKTAAAMIRIQLATAMRPSELFRMTPAMIDRSGEVWFYRPTKHKTEHHGKTKAVPLLGDALDALAPFLFGDPDDLCFTTRLRTPWNKDNYRRHVERAAKRAKVEHWTPYQIRHRSLQSIRDDAGPEAAQAIAGHSRMDTTEVYAKASEAKAIEAARAAPKL